MTPTPDEVQAGHAFYTKRALSVYDPMILGYFSRVAWRCPAKKVLAHYDACIQTNHLDVGVGTGYFLDRCHFPFPPRIALMDLNVNCLEVASRRIARYEPETYVANVLEPISAAIPTKFDSIALNYLLHCLPGTMATKGVAFDNLARFANENAIVFGATLLSGGVQRNWFARKVMDRNNKHGIFSNADDDLDSLRTVLAQHLDEPQIDVVGCVAMFSGTVR